MALLLCRNIPLYLRNVRPNAIYRAASTSSSQKSKDSLIYPEHLFPKKMPPPPRTVEDFAETKNPRVNKNSCLFLFVDNIQYFFKGAVVFLFIHSQNYIQILLM